MASVERRIEVTGIRLDIEGFSLEPRHTSAVAAVRCGVQPRTLRQYERLGLVTPRPVGGADRRYSDADIERVRRIRRLITDLGVNLASVEVILHLRDQVLALQRELELVEADRDTLGRVH